MDNDGARGHHGSVWLVRVEGGHSGRRTFGVDAEVSSGTQAGHGWLVHRRLERSADETPLVPDQHANSGASYVNIHRKTRACSTHLTICPICECVREAK